MTREKQEKYLTDLCAAKKRKSRDDKMIKAITEIMTPIIEAAGASGLRAGAMVARLVPGSNSHLQASELIRLGVSQQHVNLATKKTSYTYIAASKAAK